MKETFCRKQKNAERSKTLGEKVEFIYVFKKLPTHFTHILLTINIYT